MTSVPPASPASGVGLAGQRSRNIRHTSSSEGHAMTMGLHSKPIDGVTVNGHAPALVPFTVPASLQVLPRGPVEGWPQDVTEPEVTPGWWQRVKAGFRVIFAHRGWLAAIPVILVNAVAFGAQLGFWRAHVPATSQAAVIALALESVAIYLAYQSHLAQLADDSALRLRLAAYSFAAGIGLLNYSHWDRPGWRPTVEAVTFGMMSAISPWLWSVHSRRASRDALKAKGLIEPHAVRLGATRWQWHPVRSWRVMFRATWVGETDPAVAVALPGLDAPSPAASPEPPADVTPDAPEAPAEDISDEEEAPPPEPSPVPSPEAAEPVKPKPRKRAAPPSARARVVALMKVNPGITDAEVIKRLKVSKSTVERARSELNGAKP